ncbi:hypothetical protein LEP1GSC123_1656 [Leptospira borgpetersenii str. 200701203]|uniref:Uncharacterized protein n=1 Tax=Leptospira borgpetersenii str. 200701203 TaxID=1193007 RepID=M3GBT6_LEPBO|nr:hypothetical protein LEP1GSC123_1656 [Leptospira borgpetersenii str. 200701203]
MIIGTFEQEFTPKQRIRTNNISKEYQVLIFAFILNGFFSIFELREAFFKNQFTACSKT